VIHVVVLIHFTPEYSSRLDSKVKMTFNRKNNVRIVSLVVDLVDNVYLYLISGSKVNFSRYRIYYKRSIELK